MTTAEIISAIDLDANTARAIEALCRLASNGAKHRLVTEFKFAGDQLGASVSLERRGFGKWQAVRPATWIPLHAHSTPLLHLLLHIATHGRLPDPITPPGAPDKCQT